MTETSTKHDMNHYKSPQTMTWTIMMTQKELCIKPYGFLVEYVTFGPFAGPLSDVFQDVEKLAGFCSIG